MADLEILEWLALCVGNETAVQFSVLEWLSHSLPLSPSLTLD